MFGVTGFTGKLALEHLLEKNYKGLKFGVAARNESRAFNVVTTVCERLSERTGKSMDVIKALAPSTIEVVDLLSLLQSVGQGQLSKLFDDEGIDNLEDLEGFEVDELVEIGLTTEVATSLLEGCKKALAR